MTQQPPRWRLRRARRARLQRRHRVLAARCRAAGRLAPPTHAARRTALRRAPHAPPAARRRVWCAPRWRPRALTRAFRHHEQRWLQRSVGQPPPQPRLATLQRQRRRRAGAPPRPQPPRRERGPAQTRRRLGSLRPSTLALLRQRPSVAAPLLAPWKPWHAQPSTPPGWHAARPPRLCWQLRARQLVGGAQPAPRARSPASWSASTTGLPPACWHAPPPPAPHRRLPPPGRRASRRGFWLQRRRPVPLSFAPSLRAGARPRGLRPWRHAPARLQPGRRAPAWQCFPKLALKRLPCGPQPR